jgi:4-hydroxy-3-polyprenylbenzoate decarboxylase
VNLVLAVTGATGALAARIMMERCPWPVALVASDWGKDVYARECEPFDRLASKAKEVYDDADLAAPIASGSVPTVGMVILPCTTGTMGKIAAGLSDTLITRAAHCHLKERRPLVLCVRESPWSLVDFRSACTVTAAGGVVMPMSPPFYAAGGKDPAEVTMVDLLTAFVDRVLSVLGHPMQTGWKTPP